jgi:peptidoglycan/LPS O-acetylase OafA/YrhL
MALAVSSVVIAERGRRGRLVTLIERFPSLLWLMSGSMLMVGASYWMATADYDAYTGGPLHFIWAAMALFLVLPAAFPGTGGSIVRKFLSLRVLAWLGLISYGIYLWHLPLIPRLAESGEQLFGPVSSSAETAGLYLAVTAVTVSCAAMSYYFVERPILRLKDRRLISRSKLVDPQES